MNLAYCKVSIKQFQYNLLEVNAHNTPASAGIVTLVRVRTG